MNRIDNFLQNSLIESVGEYPDLDQQMQHFFPSIWNDLKGMFEMFVPMTSPINFRETKIITNKLKNIKLEVRINSSSARNAFTLPGVEDSEDATIMTLTGVIGSIMFIVNGRNRMSLFSNQLLNRTKMLPGKGVKFPTMPIKFLAFETKALLQDLSPEERIAIILHELGHWANIPYSISGSIYGVGIAIVRFIPPLMVLIIPLFILSVIQSRHAEWASDRFAKNLGYGPELSSALSRIGLSIRQDVSWYNKMGDIITKVVMSIQNVIDPIIPLMGHPSIKRRREALTPENVNKLLTSIYPLCRGLDHLMAGKMHKLFEK